MDPDGSDQFTPVIIPGGPADQPPPVFPFPAFYANFVGIGNAFTPVLVFHFQQLIILAPDKEFRCTLADQFLHFVAAHIAETAVDELNYFLGVHFEQAEVHVCDNISVFFFFQLRDQLCFLFPCDI